MSSFSENKGTGTLGNEGLISRRGVLSLGVLACVLGSAERSALAKPEESDEEALPKAARPVVRNFRRATGTPGLVIALYDKGNAQVWGVGRARSDRAGAPDQNTVFGIGSVTKVFTSTLFAHRVVAQPQRFKLDDPVAQHLPWLPKTGLGDIEKVTLKMLATHTAGFPEHGPSGETLFLDQQPSAELVDWWKSWKLPKQAAKKIGTVYEYSSIGTVTLGYAVSGTEYNQHLQRAINQPLGMTSTAAGTFLPKDAQLAQGHIERKGATVALDTLNVDLNSTGADMLRFLQAELGVLAAGTPLGRAIELTQAVQFPKAGKKFDMGLGWKITHKSPVVFSKNGVTSKGGASSWIGAVPSTQQGLVILTNKVATAKKYDVGIDAFAADLLAALTGVQMGKGG